MRADLEAQEQEHSGVHLMEDGLGLFGDELVSATDLNRQPGRVLDLAMRRPVTITRHDESFVLMLRQEVRKLYETRLAASTLASLLDAIEHTRRGKPLSEDHPFRWVTVFDPDDLADLEGEVLQSFRKLLRGQVAFDELQALTHEWHESALAASSPALDDAFTQSPEPEELTPPSPHPPEGQGAPPPPRRQS